jgi:hypothetical protein
MWRRWRQSSINDRCGGSGGSASGRPRTGGVDEASNTSGGVDEVGAGYRCDACDGWCSAGGHRSQRRPPTAVCRRAPDQAAGGGMRARWVVVGAVGRGDACSNLS